MATFKFTRTSLAKLEPPKPDPDTGKTPNQVLHWDSQVSGFGIRITATGTMSFIMDTRINGKKKRMTIGKYTPTGALTPERARKQADALAYQIATGGNPINEKKKRSLEAITLKEALQEYTATRKNLKQTTINDMDKTLNQVVSDWMDRPLSGITADMVIKRHTKHGEERSPAKANLAMRYLRTIINHMREAYTTPDGTPLIAFNPVDRITSTRSWFNIERRKIIIERDQLKPWLTNVMAMTNETGRDYLLLLLFTGLRRNEGLTLRWSDVDMTERTLTVRDTKNHTDHTLPLTDFLYQLFQRRQQLTGNKEFVFIGQDGESHYKGHETVVKTIAKQCGFHISLHDLRRTFATIAESLDIPAYALKSLLNHKQKHDVTAGYLKLEAERLRKPMEKITDYLLRAGGLNEPAEVVQFPEQNAVSRQ